MEEMITGVRESEKLYRSLFENMLNGFAYCRMLFHENQPQDFIYLNVNHSFEILTGLKNVIGKKVTEVIPGIRESDPKLFEIYGRVALSGRPERFEKYVEALGAWFSVSVYSPGKEYFVAVFDVITDRKRAEEALRTLFARQEALLTTVPDIIVEVDQNKVYKWANPAGFEFFGEDVIGQEAARYFEGEQGTYAVVQPLFNGDDNVVYLESWQRRRDGQKRLLAWWCRVLKDASGNVTGALSSARDITETKRMEEVLRGSEKAAQQLAEENAVMAEIGRIISSTLKIEEVYDRFAAEAHKLIAFDRIMVGLNNPDGATATVIYFWGTEVEGRRIGDQYPIAHTSHEEVMRTQAGFLVQPEAVEELQGRFSGLVLNFQAGLRSTMVVPLISRDRVIGALHLRSKKNKAYKDRDLRLAERIAAQIAGAIANAQLFLERERAEKALRESEKAAQRLAQETALVAEIGRIIGSSLNINEVYEQFAVEMHKLIHFDRISVNIINPTERTFTIPYVAGTNVLDRKSGDVIHLAGTGTEWVRQNHSTLLIMEPNREEMTGKFPGLLPVFEAGVRSMMLIPLISKCQVIGVLNLETIAVNAYKPTDLKLAEMVGSEIAGAMANAQLFLERERAERALRETKKAAQRLAHENAVMAEIGRIISSTLKIEEVYERFAAEANKLIAFDRIAVSLNNPEEGTATVTYASGMEFEGRRIGDVFPLPHSVNGEIMGTRAGLLIQPEAIEELADRFPILIAGFQAGLRSMISVPLKSRDEVIGAMHLRSEKIKAYTDRDLRMAQRIADQIAGAIANARLFQERKRAENELLKSEERYRRLVEISPLMILVHHQNKYVYANPAAAKALGASRPEELVGRSVFEVIHPDYWGIVKERISQIAQGKTISTVEEKYIRLDKTIIDVEVTPAHSLTLEEPGVMLIARDITAQRQVEKEKAALQERLQQAQKMEAIGTLAGGIAHDFNNILASILGFGELAELDMPENTKAKYNLRSSMKAALRAKHLVLQILAFSRQGKLERKPLNIRPIIKEGLKFLRASLPATIEIRQNIEEDSGTIEADPTQVHQVLMNLCTNAAHAMNGKGGVLEVSLSNLDVDGKPSAPSLEIEPGPYLRLRVSDTGHGIPPEIFKRIFDPYFTTKEVGKGTGLGLAMVHGIVKSYGGGIALSSEVGKGSTFDIYFPRIGTDNSLMEAAEGERAPIGGSERVLYVDDEEMIVEIGRNILGHLGYEVVAMTSGIEALELFRVKPDRFDLVITDMTMPHIMGDKLAQELLKIRPGIPIIIHTGFSDHITEEKAKAMGIRGFAKKPLVMKELAKAVRSALDSRMG